MRVQLPRPELPQKPKVVFEVFLRSAWDQFCCSAVLFNFAMVPISMLQYTRLGETGESDGAAALSLTKHQLITSEQSTNQFSHNLHESFVHKLGLFPEMVGLLNRNTTLSFGF